MADETSNIQDMQAQWPKMDVVIFMLTVVLLAVATEIYNVMCLEPYIRKINRREKQDTMNVQNEKTLDAAATNPTSSKLKDKDS